MEKARAKQPIIIQGIMLSEFFKIGVAMSAEVRFN
jgi:hypothetical protein